MRSLNAYSPQVKSGGIPFQIVDLSCHTTKPDNEILDLIQSHPIPPFL